MRQYCLSALALFMMAGTAQAHPGSEILTVAGKDGRQAMTDGVRYENVNGVHVYRGSASLAGQSDGQTTQSEPVIQQGDTIIYNNVWRTFRSLRTHGFYGGRRSMTRRYTQGFYSGQ